MTVPDHRFSTSLQQDDWLATDGLGRYLAEDYEDGPIAFSDVSEGLQYQRWRCHWDGLTDNFVFTPQTTGSPVNFHSAPSVTRLSFCFDQNGNASIFYTSAGTNYLYWFDTDIPGYTVTAYPTVTSGMLSLDDKRQTQTNSSDMILWYTIQQPDFTYNLYNREQRDRFLVEYLYATDVPPYVYRAGMNKGLRGQIECRFGAGA